MGQLVYGFFLYINGNQVQKYFEKFEDATEAARPHMASNAALKIQTTSDVPMKTWNYDYSLAEWVQFFRN